MATAKLWWNGSNWVTSDTTCVNSNSATSSSWAGVQYTVKLIAYDDITIRIVTNLKAVSGYGTPFITDGTKTVKSGGTTIGSGSFTADVTQYTTFSWSGNVTCGMNEYGTTTYHSGSANRESGTINITSSPFVTITYDANGGENPPNSQICCKNVDNRIISEVPTRSHYTFVGWSTNPNAANATYYSGSIINISSDTTLYAVWMADSFQLTVTRPNTADLTILKNGEVYTGTVINQDDELEIIFSPTPGFFIDAATLNGVSIDSGDTYIVNGDVVIVITTIAQYSTINEYDVSINTKDTFHLTVNRYSSSHYSRIRFYDSNEVLLYTSSVFETSTTLEIPREWFYDFPSDTSITITVENTTYTDPSGTPGSETGHKDTREFTVIADDGMKPSLLTGYVTLSPENTGTTASRLQDNVFIKGYSKVKAVFDTSKIAHTIGASIDHYAISVQNITSSVSGSNTLISTNTLTNAESVLVECYVVDSRGRYATTEETITVNDYIGPSLQPLVCKRSDNQGNEDDGGQYMTIIARSIYSRISSNSITLTLYAKRASDINYTSYGTIRDSELTIFPDPSSPSSVLFSPDESYNVKVVIIDDLLNQSSSTITMPKRSWEFHIGMINGSSGAAFGKQAEYANTLQLASNWNLKMGATDLSEAQLGYILGLRKPRVISVSLSDSSWSAHSTLTDVYTQAISITGGTVNSRVDLQADAATYLQLDLDGVTAMYVETDVDNLGNAIFTVYSVGSVPSVPIVVQATVIETL